MLRTVVGILVILAVVMSKNSLGHALAIDPSKDVASGYVRKPLPTHPIGPEGVFFSTIPATWFPDCKTDDAGRLPVIVYVFSPRHLGESAGMIAEVVCIPGVSHELLHETRFTPHS